MKTIIWLTILFFSLSPECWALRCSSGRIVNVGDSKAQVMSYCGSPQMIINDGTTGTFNVKKKGGKYREKPVEIWILTSPQVVGSLDYKLAFEGDILVDIQHISK